MFGRSIEGNINFKILVPEIHSPQRRGDAENLPPDPGLTAPGLTDGCSNNRIK